MHVPPCSPKKRNASRVLAGNVKRFKSRRCIEQRRRRAHAIKVPAVSQRAMSNKYDGPKLVCVVSFRITEEEQRTLRAKLKPWRKWQRGRILRSALFLGLVSQTGKQVHEDECPKSEKHDAHAGAGNCPLHQPLDEAAQGHVHVNDLPSSIGRVRGQAGQHGSIVGRRVGHDGPVKQSKGQKGGAK